MPRDDEEGKESSEKDGGDKKQDMPKKVYGDYEIFKAIGKGKFAVVYRARRKSDNEIVALKRMSVDQVDNKTREKCLKEIKLQQSLDHPNIIRYMDSFITENDLVIVVEWAAAGDLKRQLRKAQEKQTPFEERIIWKYFSQIADGIQHMHERRIMHRDLKPANILLTLDGTIKLGDLGLSRELSENTIQAHSKVGTPLYMSPEVLRGDGYDFKSDIWSIGCLLYELANLKSPFKSEGLNLYSLFQKISKGDYSPLPDRYSKELRELAGSMIHINAEDRPDIADICEISSRMRAKYADEYAKQRRLSKQRDKEISASISASASVSPSPSSGPRGGDTDQEGEDKSITSTASSRTAARHKYPNQHQGVVERDNHNDDDRDGYRNRELDRESDRGGGRDSIVDRDRNREKELGGEDQDRERQRNGDRDSGAGSHGFMKRKEDEHESSYPSLQKPVGQKETKLMGGLKGDEHHAHADSRAAAVTPAKNRFSEQSLGHSMSSKDSDGVREREREKQKRPSHSQGSSNDSLVALPRDSLNGHGEGRDAGGVFSQTKSGSRSPTAHKSNQQQVSPLATQQHQQQYPQRNSQQDHAYAIPLADQHAHSADTTRKREMKVKRRKKDSPEGSNRDGSSSARRGSSEANRERTLSRQLTPPRGSNYDGEDLGIASPLGMGTTTQSPAAYLMSGVARAQMEILHGKLTLLSFPFYSDASTRPSGGELCCRLCPLHFAGDLSAVLGRKAGQFPASQFHTFVQTAEWLVLRCRGVAQPEEARFTELFVIDVYADSPVSIAKQLLKMAQDGGVSSSELVNIPPSSLGAGHGDNVCLFLNLLADMALQKAKKRRGMVYPADSLEDNASAEVGDEDEDEEEDDVIEDDQGMLDAHVVMEQDDEGGTEGGSVLHMSMIVGAADGTQWREEAERVAPLLRAGQALGGKKNFTSWVSHVQTLQKHSDAILSVTSDQEGDSSESESVPALLQSVQRAVLEGVSGIARAESMLNNQQEFSECSIQYAKIKQELDRLELLSTHGGKNSIACSDRLAEVQEAAQEAASRLAEKTGETDENGVGGGGLLGLKRATQRIKEEVREMTVTIAMVQQQVMQYRVEQAAAGRKKQQKQGRRQTGRKQSFSRRSSREEKDL